MRPLRDIHRDRLLGVVRSGAWILRAMPGVRHSRDVWARRSCAGAQV